MAKTTSIISGILMIVLLNSCGSNENQQTQLTENNTEMKTEKITEEHDEATCGKCNKNSCDASCSSNPENDTTKEGQRLKELVPSCNLSQKQMVDRRAALTGKYSMFNKVQRIIELKDGYDFVFAEPKEFSIQLLEFINFERNCCSNFSFALEFEPNEKATHLKMYGSQAIKDELKNGFTELGVLNKDKLVKN